MQITYQKKDGSIIKKTRNTTLPYKIGETTSMGWKVLGVEYEYKNKFYSEYGYYKQIQKKKQKEEKKKQIVDFCKNEMNIIARYFIVILVVNFLKTL